MKFAAFAILAFATGAAAIPDDFYEQCCGDFVYQELGAFASAYEAYYGYAYDMEAWKGYLSRKIAGYDTDKCLTDMVVPGGCVGLEDVCLWWTYDAGDDILPATSAEPTGVIKNGSNGLLCCPAGNPDCGDDNKPPQPHDNPWTCATLIAWSQPFGMKKEGPDATAQGVYCGRTDVCKDSGLVCGDPHFQLWNGEWFDFHGECDLKFLENKEFGKGLGMEIQIRTKARYEYSYVEAAALKIGDDVLEVSAYGQYMFNGVENGDLKNARFADLYEIEHEEIDAQHHSFRIYTGVDKMGESEAILIKTFKDLVAVKMESAFSESFDVSTGMMGSYENGAMLARDGKTIIADPIEFGMEWQVNDSDAKLFQTASAVTGKCVMPSKNASVERRRLGEAVPLEAAVAACEAVDHVHHENCVYDVMATGDLEIAHSGVF